MPLPEDWRAFIESLNSHGVEYVVGRSRGTGFVQWAFEGRLMGYKPTA